MAFWWSPFLLWAAALQKVNHNNYCKIIIIIIIIIIAVPGDSNILQKETEKCEKYQDLAREIQRIWKSRTKLVPVVVGALGSVSKKLAGHMEQLGIKNRTKTMQKSALLGLAQILRKVLEVWGLGMRLDWIFLPRKNPCAKFYIIITIRIMIVILSPPGWLNWESAGLMSARSQVWIPAGPTLRVFK